MSYGQAVSVGSAKLSRPRGPRRMREETPMKRSLKQRFRDWLFDESNQATEYISVDEESVQLDRSSSVRFTIHQASGGRIVQTRRYDEIKDRHIDNLYIITNEMEFGREIDKIITMEALR